MGAGVLRDSSGDKFGFLLTVVGECVGDDLEVALDFGGLIAVKSSLAGSEVSPYG